MRPAHPAMRTHTVLIYSDDPSVRERIRMAVGRRPVADLGRIAYVEVDNGSVVAGTVEQGGIDLCILDGEAWPTGGLGISRQLKNEIRDCPPVLVLIARVDDAWLATWSQADGVLTQPLDAVVVAGTVAGLLRQRVGPSVPGEPDASAVAAPVAPHGAQVARPG